MDRWVGRRMSEWIDGWLEKLVDGWVDGWIRLVGTGRARWLKPVIPATGEAEAGESLEPRRQRL